MPLTILLIDLILYQLLYQSLLIFCVTTVSLEQVLSGITHVTLLIFKAVLHRGMLPVFPLKDVQRLSEHKTQLCPSVSRDLLFSP